MHDVGGEVVKQFITLDGFSIFFLLFLGFLGGLISGFIGSGGAFVLTPGMMSLGVPAAVAVATNMCHKFPKAMIGAYKRYKYGQVDLKLGIILALSAVAGVQVGIQIQKWILNSWGEAGSDLYVSAVFVAILIILGIYMFGDARRAMKSKAVEAPGNLARAIQKINIPPMIKFPVAHTRVSLWITIPIGFATGMLAATIAVGGFVGVPGMIYLLGTTSLVASATEMIIAFVMGLSGTINWALGGFVDIRLVVLIMAGSLLGVQLGAVGTTYVKDYMIKYVMSSIMIIVAISRAIAIPNYLNKLGIIALTKEATVLLSNTSFIIMCLALITGGVIILGSMWKRKREIAAHQAKMGTMAVTR
ncbi:TSUP family transporter [Desulfofundulus thermobenzoicus]|uniref:Probable membrane transporter protein n=1 Tax=Desulfofundulus thermobenzoicus TaxID=29376 RepID=A0A6N7ILZ9_9FIRM|nr:sulfite exporter TauE/SafE family protein [Desulfofundulus thermobenzoicus]MQL50954.1 TSUP family transporter [Desulfofundulus thermobenzoicus]